MHVHEAKRLLVCLRWGMGDVVMQLPALAALRRAAPRAQIDALGTPPALELLAGEDVVDAAWSTARFGLRHWGDRGDAETRAELGAWLAGAGFDLVLDAAHAARAVRRALRRHGAPVRNADPEAEARALAAGAPGWRALQRGIAAGWGLPLASGARPALALGEAELGAAARLLGRLFEGAADAASDGAEGGPRPVALSAIASSPLKRWPPRRLARVARALRARTGAPVLALEGPEGPRLRPLLPEAPGFAAAGPLRLRRLAALLAHCRLLVANDTGILHLAASVGTPVLGLFGPTRPELYLPSFSEAAAAAPREPCPFRRASRLGPPECVRRGTCLIGRGGCLGEVSVRAVLTGAAALAARSAAHAPRTLCGSCSPPLAMRPGRE